MRHQDSKKAHGSCIFSSCNCLSGVEPQEAFSFSREIMEGEPFPPKVSCRNKKSRKPMIESWLASKQHLVQDLLQLSR